MGNDYQANQWERDQQLAQDQLISQQTAALLAQLYPNAPPNPGLNSVVHNYLAQNPGLDPYFQTSAIISMPQAQPLNQQAGITPQTQQAAAIQHLQDLGPQASPPPYAPTPHGQEPAYDPYAAQRARADTHQALDYITSISTPYLGPTVTYNPYTKTYWRSQAPVGNDIMGLGRAGQLPGQEQIVGAQAAEFMAHPDKAPTISTMRAMGSRIPISESMGQFEPGPPTDETDRLGQLAASGQASSAQLHRLAQLRASTYSFQGDSWQRAVNQYYPMILAAIGSAGGGIAAGPAMGGSALSSAGFGAGWGALNAGNMSRWKDPAAIGIGAGAGFLGGWGGGYLGNATGLGPVATGAGSGAGGAFGSTVGRQVATGQFDTGDLLRNTAIGGAAGGAAGATVQTNPMTGQPIPGSGLPSVVFSAPIAASADILAPRRRNPYQ